jgi:hypothetical protein
VRCGAIDVRLIERLKRICGQGHVLTDVLATRAEAIASGNAGCTLQINAHLREQGHPLPFYHPIELVDRSIRGAGSR